MTRSHPPAKWVLLLALLAGVLYLCSRVLLPFLSIILWAGVFAVLFKPTHQRILARTPNSPAAAAFYTTALVFFAIILPILGVGLAVSSELHTALLKAPAQLLQIVQHPDPRYAHFVDRSLNLLETRFGVGEEQVRDQLQVMATQLSTILVQGTMNVVGGLIQFVVALCMILFTLFYCFRDGERMVAVLADWIPLEPVRSRSLLARIAELIHASVYGVVVLALIQGALGTLAFWVLGLPSPLLWGLVMSMFATIPMLGTFVVWIPAVIYLFFQAQYGAALGLFLWGSLVIGMSDNLLRPILVGQRTQMHELLIFFSVLGGLNVFGILGILMGPVLMAMATALLTAFRATDYPDLLAEP
ncbi:MAG: AI-2E family transporter [Candidatus Eremiobacteraeota bacterium]|nr:AI-2E family transporter [Candidatus Eremiobacteraeota bacterium]